MSKKVWFIVLTIAITVGILYVWAALAQLGTGGQ